MNHSYVPTTVNIAKNIKGAPSVRAKLVTLIFATMSLTSVLLACNGGTSEGAAVTHYHAGVGTQDEEQLQEAVEVYDQDIRLNPQDANAYNNRGNAFNDLEQYRRAIEDYDKAIRLDPELALYYNNRGISFLNMGSYQRAIQDFNEAIRVTPQLANAYAFRGLSYAALGEDVAANQDIDRALTLGIGSAELAAQLEAALDQINNIR